MGSVPPHLYGDLCHAGQRLAVFARERGEIADDEHFRVSGDRQVRLDRYSSGAIDGNAKRTPERRGGDARPPTAQSPR